MANTLEEIQLTQAHACCAPLVTPQLSPAAAQEVSDELTILAHPVRLQILSILARNQGDVCVCDLEAALPIKQPTVSHHLRLLREAGLIDCKRRGLWAYYFVCREALAALRGRIVEQLNSLG